VSPNASAATAAAKTPAAVDPELAFLKNKKVYNKEVDFVLAKATNKTWIGKELDSRWSALNGEAKAQLQVSKYDWVQANLGDKLKVIQDLRVDLNDKTHASNVSDWLERRALALKEYDQAQKTAEDFLEKVKELRGQEAELQRIQKSSEAYQKKKLGNLLEQGGFGGLLGKATANLLRATSTATIVREEKDINATTFMVFDPTSALGKKVARRLDDYQKQSQVPVDAKVAALDAYFKDNERKAGAMSIVPNSTNCPKIYDLLQLGEAELRHGQEGTSGWIEGCRPFRFRFGPSMYPQPGLGHFVSKVGTVGCSLLLLPVAPLVKAGMVVLADCPAMLNTEAGAKLVSEHGITMSWLDEDDFYAWVPYGWLPIQVCNVSEEKASYLWTLHVLSVELAKAVPNEVWQPVIRLVQDHNQRLSGEPIWKRRQEALAELNNKRG